MLFIAEENLLQKKRKGKEKTKQYLWRKDVACCSLSGLPIWSDLIRFAAMSSDPHWFDRIWSDLIWFANCSLSDRVLEHVLMDAVIICHQLEMTRSDNWRLTVCGWCQATTRWTMTWLPKTEQETKNWASRKLCINLGHIQVIRDILRLLLQRWRKGL